MQLEAMRLFCAIVETGSFTRGAARNFISQSAASQQVRALEDRFGQPLLERGGGRVRPTPAGTAAYQAFREILDRFSTLEQQLQELGQSVAGTIRVATVYSVGLHELPPFVKRFLQLYPQCRVDVEYHRTDRIYDTVSQGLFDIGIVAYPSESRRLAVIPMAAEEMVLIIPPGHPLAGRPQISPQELQGQRFVAFTRDIPTRKALDRVFHRHGVDVEVAMELDNVETIKRSVEAELGISVLPRRVVQREVEAGSLVALPIAGEGFLRPVGIVHRRGHPFSPALQRFVALLTEDTAHPIT